MKIMKCFEVNLKKTTGGKVKEYIFAKDLDNAVIIANKKPYSQDIKNIQISDVMGICDKIKKENAVGI
jgi:hypothetical protein